MPKKMLTVEIEDSGYELVSHSLKIAKAMKLAVADGFQPGQDIPVAIAALLAEFPAILAAIPNISPDLAESRALFLKGANIACWEITDLL